MIAPGADDGYIVAAYLIAAAVLVGVLIWIVLDGRAQRRRLAELESRGIRRRSAGSGKA